MNIVRNIEARAQFARFVVLGDQLALDQAVKLAFVEGLEERDAFGQVPSLLCVPMLGVAWNEGNAIGCRPRTVWTGEWDIGDLDVPSDCRVLIGQSAVGFHPAVEVRDTDWSSINWGRAYPTFEEAKAVAGEWDEVGHEFGDPRILATIHYRRGATQ